MTEEGGTLRELLFAQGYRGFWFYDMYSRLYFWFCVYWVYFQEGCFDMEHTRQVLRDS